MPSSWMVVIYLRHDSYVKKDLLTIIEGECERDDKEEHMSGF